VTRFGHQKSGELRRLAHRRIGALGEPAVAAEFVMFPQVLAKPAADRKLAPGRMLARDV
jgi:hypothetical protein